MKYLITGGAGFIGSHLVEKLLNNGHQVICIDDLSTGYREYLPICNSLRFINTKIQELNIEDFDNDIDGILHLAAQTSVPLSITDFYTSSSNNLLGMLKVWDWAKEMKVPIVYASSSAVYGNLAVGSDQLEQYNILSPYAQDKLTMEHYAQMASDVYGVKSVGLRFFNVYGPRQDPTNPYSGVISIFIDRLLAGKPVTVNGGYQTRDFIFVSDVVDVILESMKYLFSEKPWAVLNVGTGISNSIDHLLAELSVILNVKPGVIRKELPVGDPERSSGTYDKIKNILNIDLETFVKLDRGLISTIESIRSAQG